jgi:hypothetical protein
MRTLAQESVILHLGTGNYFGLDALGTRVWQLLEAGRNREEILATLLEEYDVSADTLAQDIDAFLQSLVDNGLVETG